MPNSADGVVKPFASSPLPMRHESAVAVSSKLKGAVRGLAGAAGHVEMWGCGSALGESGAEGASSADGHSRRRLRLGAG